MHLKNFPQYYVKNGRRRAVYYTAEVRDLTANGWKHEDKVKDPVVKPVSKATLKPEPVVALEPKVEVEKIEIEVVEEESLISIPSSKAELPDFEFMTKVELLEYALDRGVDLPNNALKSELVKACRSLPNG